MPPYVRARSFVSMTADGPRISPVFISAPCAASAARLIVTLIRRDTGNPLDMLVPYEWMFETPATGVDESVVVATVADLRLRTR
ncbi:hypothetical protein FEP82_06001 [Burkholderia multivorans]|nr:hypothetical protein [Burkholderia multivorans]MDR8828958.1 hypothetical protein [Burkholderia multivorans]